MENETQNNTQALDTVEETEKQAVGTLHKAIASTDDHIIALLTDQNRILHEQRRELTAIARALDRLIRTR